MVTRAQLLELGFTRTAIEHRRARGRLHSVMHGVYAVGRRELTRSGLWMAAVLSCGDGAALSHLSGGALFGITREDGGVIHVSVPASSRPRRRGIVVHRRARLEAAGVIMRYGGIPVTTPLYTLLDLAAQRYRRLDAAVTEADKLGLIDAEAVRSSLDDFGWHPGAAAMRRLLDRSTFVLTESELERHFLPIARRAGLSRPETGRHVYGFRVDFYWPDLGLVVETDGLRYHRTPLQQARDRTRDQAHTAAGLTPLRFTHAQVAFESGYVEATLRTVARRLAG